MNRNALTLQQLSISYGRNMVVQGVDLTEIQPSTLTALIGPNGAGKSTLLRGIAGLTRIRGEVLLGDTLLSRLGPREQAQRMTYMPQSLPPGVAITVIEAVLSAVQAGRSGQPGKAELDQAYDALEHLGIGALSSRYLSELSGGQRQLAALAQAIVRKPEILLLDEPTSALDPHYQVRVLGNVRKLIQAHGLIGMVVLHDISLAARFADRVTVMHGGQIAADGTPSAAITAEMMARVYAVEARVEHCSQGQIQVIVDRALDRAA